MGREAVGLNLIIRNLSWEEKGALEALRYALRCKTWKEFAAKAAYLRELVEKDERASREIGITSGEGVVLVVKADLGSVPRALREKMAMRELGIPVLGFTMPSKSSGIGEGWSPVGELLGLEELPRGG